MFVVFSFQVMLYKDDRTVRTVLCCAFSEQHCKTTINTKNESLFKVTFKSSSFHELWKFNNFFKELIVLCRFIEGRYSERCRCAYRITFNLEILKKCSIKCLFMLGNTTTVLISKCPCKFPALFKIFPYWKTHVRI